MRVIVVVGILGVVVELERWLLEYLALVGMYLKCDAWAWWLWCAEWNVAKLDAWAWYVGLLGVGWDASKRACDAWAWYVGLLGVGWDVAGVLVMRGRGTWDYLA